VAQGKLITIEGIDGAGKTTLAGGLARNLREAHGLDAHLLREPGGVELAERIRTLVKDPGLQTGGRAEALLYAAARAQLVEQAVLPLLASGSWVLLDRYVDSSLAYQGAARGLGVDDVHSAWVVCAEQNWAGLSAIPTSRATRRRGRANDEITVHDLEPGQFDE
jgi:dTMP kinase